MIRKVAGLRWYHWVVVVALTANGGAQVGSIAGAAGAFVGAFLLTRAGVWAYRKGRRATGGEKDAAV